MPRYFSEAYVGDQSGRTFMVTGANAGIGFEAAKVLAIRGARVLMACRSEEKARAAMEHIREEWPAAELVFVPLDLADLASVREAAEQARAEARLDVLINNAGVMLPPPGLTKDGFEMQFGVNHLGHFALTGLLLNKLEETAGSRVVITASIAHKKAKIDWDRLNVDSGDAWPRYQTSKLANLLHMVELDRRLKAAGRQVMAVGCHPGVALTQLSRHLPLPVRWMSPFATPFCNSAEEGSWPTLQAATWDKAKGGDYFGPQGLGEMVGRSGYASMTAQARDPAVAKHLWDVSVELTGVDPAI